ncbi:MAG: 2-oxoacid:acceptor oxidoreductase family protein [Nitrospirota bacterium]|nr:2-oxoacid:acceptor oxidoreductase family protein [Nitrospirota bacterium]
MSDKTQGQFPYPGIDGTGDGSAAVAYVEARASDAAAAYPITSSTIMGQNYQVFVANGFKNAWGKQIGWLELESEHSSASACEGYALAGGRVVNFTSGQGLILMKEVLYTTSGKRLPVVLHIASRALTSQSLNVHAGHDDVMGVTDVGWGIIFAKNVQESGDFGLIARRTAEKGRTPFMSVQDGFLVSHTIENLRYPEDDLVREYLGPREQNVRKLFDPEFPLMTGVVQNQDAYMQGKIAQRVYYDALPQILNDSYDEFYRLTGRRYQNVECTMMDDAEYAVISMGTTSETVVSALEVIRAKGIKCGAINMTTFRPFPGAEVAAALSKVKAFSVIERCDVPVMEENPLTTDILAALAKAQMGTPGYPEIGKLPVCHSGSGGLGSRDVTPGHIIAIAKNMAAGGAGKRYFSIGIEHSTALEIEEEPDVRPAGSFSIRGHSVGGYGSVTTNKVIATLMGEIFGFKVQAAPKYGSEKKGLPTNTYLSVVPKGKILTHCELQQVDFVPLMDPTTWYMGNPLVGMQSGGTVFQHTDAKGPQELWDSLPGYAKYYMKENGTRFFGVDTIAIARESCQNDPSLIQRFQGVVLLGVFLRVTPFKEKAGMSDVDLFKQVEEPLRRFFGKKGEAVVQDNLMAVKRAYERVFEVPRAIIDATPAHVLAEGKADWEAKGKDVNAFFI